MLVRHRAQRLLTEPFPFTVSGRPLNDHVVAGQFENACDLQARD
jgi:hypothetical protein